MEKMQDYETVKREILEIKNQAGSLLASAATVPGLSGEQFDRWRRTLDVIAAQMSEDVVRVAVVGAIKSGKSTLINALLGGDYLKRGAGVVTSIVTRIRSGANLKATLYFKSWDEINADVEQALVLFPAGEWRSRKAAFDLRQTGDRQALAQALNALDADLLIRDGRRNENAVLLSSYLEGYDDAQAVVSSGTGVKIFQGPHFSRHQHFVGNDALAVYLRDVLLEIKAPGLDGDVEIADCQGSDAPNPLHLAMIQDYLLMTHLIVYVISSRTGLRQADIRFLSMIREMGILDNALFVVNCDFSEHESVDTLKDLVAKTIRELALLKPAPKVYTFSSLFNLFQKAASGLNAKDRLRFEQWQADAALGSFSRSETRRFDEDFRRQLTGERYRLLLANHLERLSGVVSGLKRRARIRHDLLFRDVESTRALAARVERHQEKIGQLATMVESTLDGAVETAKRDLRARLDRLFDDRPGGVLGDTLAFIRDYQVSFSAYREHLENSGFNQTLYVVYQDFKQALDTFMARKINPRVVKFIRSQALQIKAFLESVVAPFDDTVAEALAAYSQTIQRFGIALDVTGREKFQVPDIEIVRQQAGLKLPAADIAMRYSARIRTEVIVHFGLSAAMRLMRRVFKRQVQEKDRETLSALKRSVRRIKHETVKSVSEYFVDYRENLKFQYLFRLLDAFRGHLSEELRTRLQNYAGDLGALSEQATGRRMDKQKAAMLLQEMVAACQSLEQRILVVRQEISPSADERAS